MAKNTVKEKYFVKYNEELGKHILVESGLGKRTKTFTIEPSTKCKSGLKLVEFI